MTGMGPAGRPAARTARPAQRRGARTSRIQRLYEPAIDASRPELSTDVRVDWVLPTAIPSYQQSKSSGAKLGSESARCKVRNVTPTVQYACSTYGYISITVSST